MALKGYSLTEKKFVTLSKAVINKHKNGARTLYHVMGEHKGKTVCTALSETSAMAAIKSKEAKKGTGW